MITTLNGVSWFELGIHLNVPPNTLKTIKKESDGQVERLASMFQYCFDNQEMSWEKIIEALEKMNQHGNIISTIKAKYITPGNFVREEC